MNTTDGTTAGTISAGTLSSGIYAPGTISATQATAGEAFSFSTSYLQGDAVPTSAPTVGDVGNFSSQTSYSNLKSILQNPLTAPVGNPSLFLVNGGRA